MSNADVVLMAGTTFGYDAAGDGTFVIVNGITSIGAIGFSSEAKERTTLADTTKKYGAGLKDAPDKAIKMQYYSGDTVQAAFVTKCKALEEFDVQVTFTNLGETHTFKFQSLGFEIDEGTGEDWTMATINGKQNSDPVVAQVP